jgi:hypothetical protein
MNNEERTKETRKELFFSMTLKQCITCIASLFPAWDPPLITLKAGTGNTKLLLPARLAMCCTKKQINVRNNFKWIDIKLVK